MTIAVSVWSFKNEERLILGKSIYFSCSQVNSSSTEEISTRMYKLWLTQFKCIQPSFWPFIFSRMHLSFWEDCDNHGLEFVIKEQVKFVIAPFIKLKKGKSGKCLSYSSQSFQNWPKDASSLPENIIHEICIYKITRSMIDWICSYLLAPRPATSLVKN